MLNKSRIKLMTKMSVYEEHEGKKSMSIGTYFRGDYIGKEVIKSIVYATVAYLIIIAIYICYDFEILAQDIYNMDLVQFGAQLLKDYLKLVVGYAIITYIYYAMRYQAARRSLRSYYNNLRRLNAMYRKEEESKYK